MYELMCLQLPLLSESLVTDPAAILALLLKVSECPVEQEKNMTIPVGRYVSWEPHCSEMFSWYGERSKRGERKGGTVWVNKEIVEHFSCYTLSLEHS
jgi:hypothetical protein